jgi:ankyrin repeat protein
VEVSQREQRDAPNEPQTSNFKPQTFMPDIFDACRRGDLAAVEQLYAEGPQVIHSSDFRGFTPLILAVYNDQPGVADFLLQHGAHPDAQDAAGNSALMGVCFKGYKELALRLLDAGADVNLRNVNGATALTFAATFGHLQIAEWLLERGADISVTDARGKSPLDHAYIQENEGMIQLLEKWRAGTGD